MDKLSMYLRTSVVCIALITTGCDLGSADIYTLYRSSAVATLMRIHVATFDAEQSSSYNWENCQIASKLFHDQEGVTVSYWCEKGRYRS